MSRKLSHLRWCVVSILLVSLMGCTSVPEGIAPVQSFDVNRYTGVWYEIARFDHSFERGMSNVTATYTLREDGGIDVLNRGFIDAEERWDSADGKAYFVSDETTGHLKVSFFGPFYASYVVFELDHDNYEFSLVTGPNRDYLWLLARSPEVSKSVKDHFINVASHNGFDIEKLIWIDHDRQ